MEQQQSTIQHVAKGQFELIFLQFLFAKSQCELNSHEFFAYLAIQNRTAMVMSFFLNVAHAIASLTDKHHLRFLSDPFNDATLEPKPYPFSFPGGEANYPANSSALKTAVFPLHSQSPSRMVMA